eukprot:Nk52_evm10s151 gene=Nk52_evmTU10s151
MSHLHVIPPQSLHPSEQKEGVKEEAEKGESSIIEKEPEQEEHRGCRGSLDAPPSGGTRGSGNARGGRGTGCALELVCGIFLCVVVFVAVQWALVGVDQRERELRGEIVWSWEEGGPGGAKEGAMGWDQRVGVVCSYHNKNDVTGEGAGSTAVCSPIPEERNLPQGYKRRRTRRADSNDANSETWPCHARGSFMGDDKDCICTQGSLNKPVTPTVLQSCTPYTAKEMEEMTVTKTPLLQVEYEGGLSLEATNMCNVGPSYDPNTSHDTPMEPRQVEVKDKNVVTTLFFEEGFNLTTQFPTGKMGYISKMDMYLKGPYIPDIVIIETTYTATYGPKGTMNSKNVNVPDIAKALKEKTYSGRCTPIGHLSVTKVASQSPACKGLYEGVVQFRCFNRKPHLFPAPQKNITFIAPPRGIAASLTGGEVDGIVRSSDGSVSGLRTHLFVVDVPLTTTDSRFAMLKDCQMTLYEIPKVKKIYDYSLTVTENEVDFKQTKEHNSYSAPIGFTACRIPVKLEIAVECNGRGFRNTAGICYCPGYYPPRCDKEFSGYLLDKSTNKVDLGILDTVGSKSGCRHGKMWFVSGVCRCDYRWTGKYCSEGVICKSADGRGYDCANNGCHSGLSGEQCDTSITDVKFHNKRMFDFSLGGNPLGNSSMYSEKGPYGVFGSSLNYLVFVGSVMIINDGAVYGIRQKIEGCSQYGMSATDYLSRTICDGDVLELQNMRNLKETLTVRLVISKSNENQASTKSDLVLTTQLRFFLTDAISSTAVVYYSPNSKNVLTKSGASTTEATLTFNLTSVEYLVDLDPSFKSSNGTSGMIELNSAKYNFAKMLNLRPCCTICQSLVRIARVTLTDARVEASKDNDWKELFSKVLGSLSNCFSPTALDQNVFNDIQGYMAMSLRGELSSNERNTWKCYFQRFLPEVKQQLVKVNSYSTFRELGMAMFVNSWADHMMSIQHEGGYQLCTTSEDFSVGSIRYQNVAKNNDHSFGSKTKCTKPKVAYEQFATWGKALIGESGSHSQTCHADDGGCTKSDAAEAQWMKMLGTIEKYYYDPEMGNKSLGIIKDLFSKEELSRDFISFYYESMHANLPLLQSQLVNGKGGAAHAQRILEFLSSNEFHYSMSILPGNQLQAIDEILFLMAFYYSERIQEGIFAIQDVFTTNSIGQQLAATLLKDKTATRSFFNKWTAVAVDMAGLPRNEIVDDLDFIHGLMNGLVRKFKYSKLFADFMMEALDETMTLIDPTFSTDDTFSVMTEVMTNMTKSECFRDIFETRADPQAVTNMNAFVQCGVTLMARVLYLNVNDSSSDSTQRKDVNFNAWEPFMKQYLTECTAEHVQSSFYTRLSSQRLNFQIGKADIKKISRRDGTSVDSVLSSHSYHVIVPAGYLKKSEVREARRRRRQDGGTGGENDFSKQTIGQRSIQCDKYEDFFKNKEKTMSVSNAYSSNFGIKFHDVHRIDEDYSSINRLYCFYLYYIKKIMSKDITRDLETKFLQPGVLDSVNNVELFRKWDPNAFNEDSAKALGQAGSAGFSSSTIHTDKLNNYRRLQYETFSIPLMILSDPQMYHGGIQPFVTLKKYCAEPAKVDASQAMKGTCVTSDDISSSILDAKCQ